MKIGTLVKDKETGQYLVTASDVSTDRPGGPLVRVRPHRRGRTFAVWTSSVEAVKPKDNPFRRTYSQWVLFVIAEVLTVTILIMSLHTLQNHGLGWWQVVAFASPAMATFNTLVYRLFGLHQ